MRTKKKVLGAVVAGVVLAAAAQATVSAATVGPPTWILRKTAVQVGGLPGLARNMAAYTQTQTSTSWSGYVATGARFNRAVGAWYEPTATCSPGETTYSSYWVGIDGYGTPTVEQAGTDADCQNGQPVYYAWYELYPQPSYAIVNLAIRPGDQMGTTISYSGSNVTLQVVDYSTGQSFSKTEAFNGSGQVSAEWIEEAPSSGFSLTPLPLARNTGTFFWGNADAGRGYQPISAFNPVEISMRSPSGVPEVQPSGLVDGSLFAMNRLG